MLPNQPDILLPDLIANGTLDAPMGALLWSIADEKKSFVVAAGPRKAGKSTVLNAALHHVPEGTPIHRLSGEIDEIRGLAELPDGGYLEVGEISTEPPARYIWGEPVAALFNAVERGFSLATTMHATHCDEVFSQICEGNLVPDAQAALIEFVIIVRRFGDGDDNYWRRVDHVCEVQGVRNGKAEWVELFDRQGDEFRQSASPTRLRATNSLLEERAELLRSSLRQR